MIQTKSRKAGRHNPNRASRSSRAQVSVRICKARTLLNRPASPSCLLSDDSAGPLNRDLMFGIRTCWNCTIPAFADFPVFAPERPGICEIALRPTALIGWCKHVTFHCKTLHWVKPVMMPQGPRLAWSAYLIAPPPGFAQFSNAKPVGGRGISDFSGEFFLATRILLSISGSLKSEKIIIE